MSFVEILFSTVERGTKLSLTSKLIKWGTCLSRLNKRGRYTLPVLSFSHLLGTWDGAHGLSSPHPLSLSLSLVDALSPHLSPHTVILQLNLRGTQSFLGNKPIS
jgi:hypothetical protein